MHAWKAIQNSLEYIEEHLTEEISTEKLADTVGLSPFYFQRLFKRLVRKPDYGFSSHANFTRTLRDVSYYTRRI